MKKAGPLSILIAVTLLTAVVIAEAQQPKKIPRIGLAMTTLAATFALLPLALGISRRRYAATAGDSYYFGPRRAAAAGFGSSIVAARALRVATPRESADDNDRSYR